MSQVRSVECGVRNAALAHLDTLSQLEPLGATTVRNVEWTDGNAEGRIVANHQWKGLTMSNENLKKRTKKFALDVIKLVESLPHDPTSRILGGQLLRCGTSVGANYRSACRAKSGPDFIAKMGTVEEEADETGFWLEVLVESGKLPLTKTDALSKEADELTAIAVASINTARGGHRS